MNPSNIITSKVKVSHLTKNAYLYIRQSTLKQVLENSESTKRQYALKNKIKALGWSENNIITIDNDLGQSGAEAQERVGFQQLVSEVGIGNAGIVVGIEVSRLSRSSADWSRLMEICAITNTLIMDEDGVYNVNDFNDRLLLGLKGTMSEAELHYLQARMRGGLLNKAKRGDLEIPLPIGYAYNENKQIIKEPDLQIQEAIKKFFQTFRRVGSASGAVKFFNSNGLRFPIRVRKGVNKGDLHWVQLTHSKATYILHNQTYAGIYIYGKNQLKHTVGGKKVVPAPKEEWYAFLRDSHASYITEEEFEENQKILRENTHSRREEQLNSPVREGSALLQGIVVCGKCGGNMTLRYATKKGKQIPIYQCQQRSVRYSEAVCQSVHGENIDKTISNIALETINPLTINAVINVQREMEERKNEIQKHYEQQLERARYSVELAKKRYMNVDPDNRLVASELEMEWNKRINEYEVAQEECNKKCKSEVKKIDDTLENELKQISSDFPEIWNNPKTSNREKKRMIRCIIENVTLTSNDDYITMGINFKGGTTKVIKVSKPIKRSEEVKTSENILNEIDRLMFSHTNIEIADILNQAGFISGTGKKFSPRIVTHLIQIYKIESRFSRFRKFGLLTAEEKQTELGISRGKLRQLRENNKVKSYCYSRNRNYLYEPENYSGKVPVSNN